MSNLFQLYAVHEGGDERSSGEPKWFFTDRTNAELVSYGRGWFGGNAVVSYMWAIKDVDGRVYLMATPKGHKRPESIVIDDPTEISKAKEAALAKLDPAARRFLGL